MKSPEQFVKRFNDELYEDLKYVGRWEKAGDSLRKWVAGVAGTAADLGSGVSAGCGVGAAVGAIFAEVFGGTSAAAGCATGAVYGLVIGYSFVAAGLASDDVESMGEAAYHSEEERAEEYREREEEIASIFDDIMMTDNLKYPRTLYDQNTATAFKYLGSFFKLDFNSKDLLVKEWLATAK